MSLSRILRVTVCGALFAFLAAPVRLSGQAASPQEKKAKHELPTRAVSAVLGDFDVLKKRRVIRLLVVYNKTNYFIDKGTPRGITYDAFKLFEDELNKKYKTGNLRIHVTFIPVARADLADALLSGRGDVAAANLTVTPERLEKADFSNPGLTNVSEIVVSGPTAEPVATVDDLSGKEVFVRKGSIFHESVEKLNADLSKRGKAPEGRCLQLFANRPACRRDQGRFPRGRWDEAGKRHELGPLLG